MKECENCKIPHDGKYGSGRFCSSFCSRAFSTKGKREIINNKVSLTFKENLKKGIKMGFINTAEKEKRICPVCEEEFEVSVNKKKNTCSLSCSSKFSWQSGKYNKVDWSRVNLESYSTGKNYVGGGTTKWIKYRDIKVQGSYEYRACEILDQMVNRNEIKDWKYGVTRINYYYEGKERTYIIDFTLYNLDDSEKHIEVKGREEEIDHIKWKEAEKQGLDLSIWRYKDLFN
jgi:hypothetical protein